MIQLQRHHIHSPLSVETIHARIQDKVTNNIGLALSPSQNFLFSGTITSKGFTLSPIQKGRLFPIPRLHGTYHPVEQGTDIVVVGKPGTSATLDILAWCIAGFVLSMYAVSFHGIYAVGVSIFPLSIIALKVWLLHREIQVGINLITDLLRDKIQ